MCVRERKTDTARERKDICVFVFVFVFDVVAGLCVLWFVYIISLFLPARGVFMLFLFAFSSFVCKTITTIESAIHIHALNLSSTCT